MIGFFIMMSSQNPPPAPVKPVDLDRLIDCIIGVNGANWPAPGGALCFTRAQWYEDSDGTPYFYACQEKPARRVAKVRLKRFSSWFERHGYDATPERLGQAWRHNLFSACRRIAHAYTPTKEANFGELVSALYYDEAFKT
jgi:hypothetical protein